MLGFCSAAKRDSVLHVYIYLTLLDFLSILNELILSHLNLNDLLQIAQLVEKDVCINISICEL